MGVWVYVYWVLGVCVYVCMCVAVAGDKRVHYLCVWVHGCMGMCMGVCVYVYWVLGVCVCRGSRRQKS